MAEKKKNNPAGGFDLSQWRKDVAGAENGVWTPDLGQGARLKIRYIKSQKYQEEFREAIRLHRDDLRSSTFDDNKKYLGEAIARGLVADWENIHLDGKPLEYSEENALKIFTDETFSAFRDYVFDFAQQFENTGRSKSRTA